MEKERMAKWIRRISHGVGLAVLIYTLFVPYGEILGVKLDSIIKMALSKGNSQFDSDIMALLFAWVFFLGTAMGDTMGHQSYTILDDNKEEQLVSYRTAIHCLIYAAATLVVCIVFLVLNNRIVKEYEIKKNPMIVLILLSWAIINVGAFIAYFLERDKITDWEYRRRNIDVDEFIVATQDEYDDEDEIEEKKKRLEKQKKAFEVPIGDALVYLVGIVASIVILLMI